jgi:hypothetical protein
MNKETADPLSSAARSDTREPPLSRPDPAPAGPSGGRLLLGNIFHKSHQR